MITSKQANTCTGRRLEKLKNIAHEIRSIRLKVGESNSQVERFLHYCSLRGANVPGEPELAQTLLDEVESASSRT
jgi:hypothetical protein